MNTNKGFTLVEIVVAMMIGILLLMAIYGVVNIAQRSSSGIERRVMAQQDEKAALGLMEMEIRMVSFNPNFVLDGDLWLSTANCFSASATPTYKGLQEATANAITIEMDINESSSIGDVENEIIRYNYDTANQQITRESKRPPPGSCNPGGQPFLGGSVANQKTVRVINNTLGLPVFRYWNGSGTELIPGVTLPASTADIRRIDITLAVETEYANPTTNQPSRMIYSSSVIVRNHAPAQ
jgi:prepilin-type N-terminal cleavage/methylation domain-containing protein